MLAIISQKNKRHKMRGHGSHHFTLLMNELNSEKLESLKSFVIFLLNSKANPVPSD